jgi:hypothetical protein
MWAGGLSFPFSLLLCLHRKITLHVDAFFLSCKELFSVCHDSLGKLWATDISRNPNLKHQDWGGTAAVDIFIITVDWLHKEDMLLCRSCLLWEKSMTSLCWESLWWDGTITKSWCGGCHGSSITLIGTLLQEDPSQHSVKWDWCVSVIWYVLLSHIRDDYWLWCCCILSHSGLV